MHIQLQSIYNITSRNIKSHYSIPNKYTPVSWYESLFNYYLYCQLNYITGNIKWFLIVAMIMSLDT